MIDWLHVFNTEIWVILEEAKEEINEYIAQGDIVKVSYCARNLADYFEALITTIEMSLPSIEIHKANFEAAFGSMKNWEPKFKVNAARRNGDRLKMELLGEIEKFLEGVEGGE